MVSFMCDTACTKPFDGFNATFAGGVPDSIRQALTQELRTDDDRWNHVMEPDQGFAPMPQSDLEHFQEHWLVDANGKTPQRAGADLYRVFTEVLEAAEPDKPVAAIWVEGLDFDITPVDLGASYLVVVTSPTPPGNNPHDGGCSIVEKPPATD